MGKGFSKDKFFYGYKCEAMFQQTFPKSKKLSKQADFELEGYLFEIGRSRILEKRVIVYFRKIFYNVKKEFHKYKEMDCKEFLYYYKHNQKVLQRVHPNDFYFVYFTNNLQYFALFTFNDMLDGELKMKRNGEYYFNLRVPKLNETKHLYKIIADEIGLDTKQTPKHNEKDYGF